MNERPLSPFLVYRFMYTMLLSFAHRISGVCLSMGALLLTYGLVALAGDSESFERARVFFGHWILQVVLLGLTIAFFFHLANGIRHLLWDLGHGYEKREARRSAVFVIVATILLTALALWLALRSAGGV